MPEEANATLAKDETGNGGGLSGRANWMNLATLEGVICNRR